MRTLDSWRREEERLRAAHTRLTGSQEWLKAQTVREKLIRVLDKIKELETLSSKQA